MWACQGFSVVVSRGEAGAVRPVGDGIVGGDVRCCSWGACGGLAWEVKLKTVVGLSVLRLAAGQPALSNVQQEWWATISTSRSRGACNFTNTARIEVSFEQAEAGERGWRCVSSDQIVIFDVFFETSVSLRWKDRK